MYIFTKFEKNCDTKLIFFLGEKVYILLIEKKKNSICHRTNINSIFKMSSYRNPEIQNDLPKLTKVKLIFFQQNFDQESFCMLFLAF